LLFVTRYLFVICADFGEVPNG